jgi:superfamily II RNA helicase
MGGEDETKSSAIVPSNQALGARLETDSAVQRQSVGVNLVTFDGKSCTHEVAWPQGREAGSFEPPPKRPGPPAREYPFKIDPFQQVSVNALEAGARKGRLLSTDTRCGI